MSTRGKGRLGGSRRLRLLEASESEGHRPETSSVRGIEFFARAGFIAAALFAYQTGLKVYQGSGIWAPSVPLGLLLYSTAAVCLISAFILRDPTRRGPQLWVGAFLLLTLTFSVWYEIDFGNPAYGTDSLAFAHTGAEVLLDGQNPYGVVGDSVRDAINRFGLQDTVVTRSTSGQPIERMISYPGGHVLVYTGALAMGIDDLRWATMAFEVGALILIWVMLSPVGRLFVPFALLLEDNLTVFFTSGAVTDWLWVLPLVVAAYYLHRERFGYAGLALGLACAFKQQPWFLLPFAVIWVYQTLARRSDAVERRDGLVAFLAGTATGFLLLNLPFMVWSMSDWVQGILHPALGGLVPDGQGLSVLASRGLLPLPGGLYTAALAAGVLLVMWAYARWFERMQDLLWILPPALLLLSQRSFHSYFVFWIPLALFWLDLRLNQPQPEAPESTTSFESHTSRSFAIVALVVALGLGIAAVTTLGSTPLDVGQVTPALDGGVIRSLYVEVTNNTDEQIEPVFELYWRGQPLPWRVIGEHVVEPRQSATLEIAPRSTDGIPPIRLSSTGSTEIVEFRVRVNDAESGVYTSSDVVELAVSDLVVNPEMEFWTRENTIFAAPYGWRAAVHGVDSSRRSLEPAENGMGAALSVTSLGAGPIDWVETALLQDVGSFSECYVWEFEHDLGYRTDSGGSPIAVSGIQFNQGDSAVWFVPSTGTDGKVTTLSDGTVVVEVNAPVETATTAYLDVATYAETAGIDLTQGGLIKLFGAVHETIAAQSGLVTHSLRAGCPLGG